jgi:ATP-dependent Clp protease ATP-binding subunit ClpA
MSMWEPFSEHARRAMVVAQEVAQRLNTPYIDSEHIVLGAVEVGDNPVVAALSTFDISAERFREAAERTIGLGAGAAQHKEMVFTPRAKRMIELAFEQARSLQHRYIGTEHIMLAYLAETQGKSELLRDLNVDPNALRTKLLEIVPTGPPAEEQASSHKASRVSFDDVYKRTHALAKRSSPAELWERAQTAAQQKDLASLLLFAFGIAIHDGSSPDEILRRIQSRLDERD